MKLTKIINASIKIHYVPRSWKEATVVMLPKPMKDHKQPENYRPISLLNTLSQLLERIILVRLRAWISTNKILSKYQCGFRHNRQTKDQILRIIQEALKAFNLNEYMGAIFIDIEKAFDKVWHKGLLHKLDQLRIPAYLGKWIQNYLSSRYFKIKIGKIFSEFKVIEAGVPQGSVLGPILFNIFFGILFSYPFHSLSRRHLHKQKKTGQDAQDVVLVFFSLASAFHRITRLIQRCATALNKYRT